MGSHAESVPDPVGQIPNLEPIRTMNRSPSPQSRRQSPVLPAEPSTVPTSCTPIFHSSPSPQPIQSDHEMANIIPEQIPQSVSAQTSHSTHQPQTQTTTNPQPNIESQSQPQTEPPTQTQLKTDPQLAQPKTEPTTSKLENPQPAEPQTTSISLSATAMLIRSRIERELDEMFPELAIKPIGQN